MIEYNFDPNIEILKVKFSGSIGLDDIKDYVNRIAELDNLSTNLNILNDMVDVHQYVSVHEKPQSTAISTLIRERNRFRNMEYRVFSSSEAALEWLMIK